MIGRAEPPDWRLPLSHPEYYCLSLPLSSYSESQGGSTGAYLVQTGKKP